MIVCVMTMMNMIVNNCMVAIWRGGFGMFDGVLMRGTGYGDSWVIFIN